MPPAGTRKERVLGASFLDHILVFFLAVYCEVEFRCRYLVAPQISLAILLKDVGLYGK